MTALDHLRKLLNAPMRYSSTCPVCGDFVGHKPDCPWVAAKGFVERQDANLKKCADTHARAEAIRQKPRGFTLIELLVVILIILAVSAVALPMIAPALSHRQVSEGARSLQAALAGARDAAIRDNSLSGIRLLLDPSTPNAVNRVIPLQQPPGYSNGLVTNHPGLAYAATVLLGTQALVLEEAVTDTTGQIVEPTSWAWNVRQGDKIQINNAGRWYTICGPVTTANAEGFINYGSPGTASPLGHDYLLLTNGIDDNANGWADEGFDGVDNDGDALIDETTCTINPAHGEWEQEAWIGSLTSGVTALPYTIVRRPLPGTNAREVALPSNVVIDLSRSNLPTALDLLCRPDGTWAPSIPWGVPSSIGMGGSFFQFWLAERSDIGSFSATTPPAWVQSTPTGQWHLVSVNGRTGRVLSFEQPDTTTGLSDARQE